MTSWLKSLETVLEKVDSTAAASLTASSSSSSKRNSTPTPTKGYTGTEISKEVDHEREGGERRLFATPDRKYVPQQQSTATSAQKSPRDEDLFDFLNAPMEEVKKQREKSRTTVRKGKLFSDQENTSLAVAPKATNATPESIVDALETKANNRDTEDTTPNSSDTKSVASVDQSTLEVSDKKSYDEDYEKLMDQNADLQLENKLNEVISLNQEISSLVSRTKSTQQDYDKVLMALQDAQKSLFEKEKLISKLKHTEEELDGMLSNKNTQLASMQVKLDEDLRLRDERIHSLQDKIDKMVNDKESSTEAHLHSKQLIKERVDQLEKLLKDEETAHNTTRQNAQARERELEASVAEITKALASTQRSLEEKSGELGRTYTQLKELQDTSKAIKQELVDYKLRATKVLQDKDKTIKELSSQLSSASPSSVQEVSLADLITVQQERDSLKEEREELKQTIEQLRATLQETQTQVEADIEVLQAQIRDLEVNLEREQKRTQSLQMDVLLKSQELVSTKDDMDKKLESNLSILRSRDEEITKLKRQLAAKSMSSSSQEELENRLQAITEHLIQKQNQLDAASTEKAYLQLQVETLLQSQNERKIVADDKHSIVIDDTTKKRRGKEESGPRLRPIASLVDSNTITSPNSAIARRVVGAANFIDSLRHEI